MLSWRFRLLIVGFKQILSRQTLHCGLAWLGLAFHLKYYEMQVSKKRHNATINTARIAIHAVGFFIGTSTAKNAVRNPLSTH
jgi:preprotein translocase subunit SecG